MTALGLVAAACSSSEEPATPTLELTTTSAVITTTTSTTEAETTTTVDPRIAEVEQAVTDYVSTVEALLADVDLSVDRLGSVAGPDLAAEVGESILKGRAEGRTASGSFVHGASSPTILSDDLATVERCGLDGVTVFGADGEPVFEADTLPRLRLYSVQRDGDGWIVESFQLLQTGSQSCEL